MIGTVYETSTAAASTAVATVNWTWVAARAFGLTAFLSSTALMCWGLLVRTRLGNFGGPPRRLVAAHQSLAVATLLLVIGHIVALVLDPWLHLSIAAVLVPGLSSWRTLAVAMGSLAFWALLAGATVGLLRTRIPNKIWRRVHRTAFAVWPLTLMHYVLAGTDVATILGWLSVSIATSILLFLVLVRGWTAPPRPTPRTAPPMLARVD